MTPDTLPQKNYKGMVNMFNKDYEVQAKRLIMDNVREYIEQTYIDNNGFVNIDDLETDILEKITDGLEYSQKTYFVVSDYFIEDLTAAIEDLNLTQLIREQLLDLDDTYNL